MITTIPGEMRLRRQIVRAFIRHEKSWIATHFQMKEQRVSRNAAFRNASKNRSRCAASSRYAMRREIVSSKLRGTTGHE
jgi:precorrin-2 methylase